MQVNYSARRAGALIFVIVFLFSAVAPARPSASLPQQPDAVRKLPPTNWLRSRKIDVKHLAIDLRFDWQKKQAYGTTVVTFAPFNKTDRATLDAGMLTINSITFPNGKPLKFNYDGGDKNDGLEILLDRAYAAGEDVTVKIDYHTNWVNISDPNNLWGSFFDRSQGRDRSRPRKALTAGSPTGQPGWGAWKVSALQT